MKILFFIESMDAQCGGPAIEISRLSDYLLNNETEITIVSFTEINKTIPINSQVKYVCLSKINFLPFRWMISVFRLNKLFSQHDIIFNTGIWGPFDGFIISLLWKKRKAVFIRVCGMLEPYILARNKWKKKIGKLLYVKKNLNHANGLIVNSKEEAQNLEKLGIPVNKIHIIPNGVALQEIVSIEEKERLKYKYSILTENKVLLYLGRIHPKKGLHLLLISLSEILKEKKNIYLIVAGEFSDEGYENKIRTIVSDLKLTNHVKFTGLVVGEVKREYFKLADCFILPSESEGLPNAVLEALSFGLPIILTKGCNLPEIEEYKAGIIKEFSVESLQEGLSWFLSPKFNFSILSSNARILLQQKFSPQTSVENYREILKTVFGKT